MRHGQTLFNERRKIQGHCDSPLTEKGKNQVKTAGDYFKAQNIQLDAAYCSTSERCSDSLELVIGDDMPYTRLKGLKERNFGIYEAESEDLHPRDYYARDLYYVQFGGECRDDVRARMVSTCIDIMEKATQNGQTHVIAMSHMGAMVAFLKQWQEPEPELEKGFPNACICKYEYKDKTFTLVEVIRQ